MIEAAIPNCLPTYLPTYLPTSWFKARVMSVTCSASFGYAYHRMPARKY